MDKRIRFLINYNALMLIVLMAAVSRISYLSQFASAIFIFTFPGLALTLYKNNDLINKISKTFIFSTLISICVLIIFIFLNLPLTRVSYIFTLILISNFIFIFNFLKKKQINLPNIKKKVFLSLIFIILLTGILNFYGANKVVPLIQDHDSVTECPVYGLITYLKPHCIETFFPFYFAKGPTTHIIYGFPMIITMDLERVKHYYDSSIKSVQLEKNKNYYKNIKKIRDNDVKIFFSQEETIKIKLRTVSIFISIIFTCIMFLIIYKITGSLNFSILLIFMFILLPEVFVRGSYAGYTNITNLFLIICIYNFIRNQEDLITPIFLATINFKGVILLIFSITLWNLFHTKDIRKIFINKTIIGLILGLFILLIYGFSVSPESYVGDSFYQHGINQFGMNSLNLNNPEVSVYPTIFNLWLEFIFNFGFIFFIFFIYCYVNFIRKVKNNGRNKILVYFILVGSLVFSIIQWKQTNHLNLIVPAMILVIAYNIKFVLINKNYKVQLIYLIIILLILINNILIIYNLWGDFNWLKLTPAW